MARNSTKYDDAELAAAQARQQQAQQAINERTRKANDELYQKAKDAKASEREAHDNWKTRVKTLEANIATMQEKLAKKAADDAKKAEKQAKMTPAQRRISQATSNIGLNQFRGVSTVKNSRINSVTGLGPSAKSSSNIMASAMDAINNSVGGYEVSQAGMSKLKQDLDKAIKRRDELGKTVDPKYLTPEVAPMADPAMFRRRTRNRSAREASARSGRQSTILSGA